MGLAAASFGASFSPLGINVSATFGASPGFAQWKLAFGISPIIFVGGIAGSMAGGQLPIISVTDSLAFGSGPLGQLGLEVGLSLNGVSATASLGAVDPGLDGYFALYEPLPGSTLEDFEYGRYPFANQSVAANAVIQEPLVVSMLMVCPVKGTQSWSDHLSIMTSLKSAMDQHAALGGSYTVATPKFIYTDCLLAKFSDATAGQGLQPQSRWRLDFWAPLITLAQAQQAQNGLMSKISSQTQMLGQPSLSGGQPVIGQPLTSATPPSVPASTPLPGANAPSASSGPFAGVSPASQAFLQTPGAQGLPGNA